MIETAYLPERVMERPNLAKLREDLLSRQVDEWNDKLKYRRDKRELRLLN